MQRIRGTLFGSTLIGAVALTGLAYAGDEHPPASPEASHSEPANNPETKAGMAKDREQTKAMQRTLTARNLYQGQVDGVWGPKTESALRNFQTQNGLDATGQLNPRTAEALGIETEKQTVSGTDMPASGNAAQQTQTGSEHDATNMQLKTLTPEQGKEMQQRLQLLGYYRGEVDGVVGEGTRAALQRFFQQQAELASKGVISNAAIGLFGTEPSDVQPVKGTDAPSQPAPAKSAPSQPAH